MDKTLIRLLEKAQNQYHLGVEGQWSPDDVHDYRVAIRKARAYLKFWRADSKAEHKRMKNRLRFLQRQTALVREWDVFFERFGAAIDEKAAAKGMFGRFLLVENFKQGEAVWQDVHTAALKIKGRPLRQREKKLLQRIFRTSEAQYVDWHQLRILIKGYRYTLARKSKPDQTMIHLLREWQDLLGVIQDAYTNRKWLEWLGEEKSIVGQKNEVLLEMKLKEAEEKLPGFLATLQKQHP